MSNAIFGADHGKRTSHHLSSDGDNRASRREPAWGPSLDRCKIANERIEDGFIGT